MASDVTAFQEYCSSNCVGFGRVHPSDSEDEFRLLVGLKSGAEATDIQPAR